MTFLRRPRMKRFFEDIWAAAPVFTILLTVAIASLYGVLRSPALARTMSFAIPAFCFVIVAVYLYAVVGEFVDAYRWDTEDEEAARARLAEDVMES